MTEFDRLAKVWAKQLPKNEDSLGEHEYAFFPEFLEKAKRASRILEIGAGRGRMIRVLRQHGVEAEVVALDLNDYVIEANAMAVQGNTLSLPFREASFDLVYSLGVVEHFPETDKAVEEHIRVLKPDGTLLITTPHLSPYTIFRWLVWLMKFRRDGSFEQTLGRNLTIGRFVRVLQRNNLICISKGASGVFLPSHTRKIHPLMEKVFPNKRFGAYLWVIAHKPDKTNDA